MGLPLRRVPITAAGGGRYLFRQPYGRDAPGLDPGWRPLSTRHLAGQRHGGRWTTAPLRPGRPVWRWRTAYQNDFAARIRWTMADFTHSNHAPVAMVNGEAGTAPLVLDAPIWEASGARCFRLYRSAIIQCLRTTGSIMRRRVVRRGRQGRRTALANLTLSGADTERVTIMPGATCRSRVDPRLCQVSGGRGGSCHPGRLGQWLASDDELPSHYSAGSSLG